MPEHQPTVRTLLRTWVDDDDLPLELYEMTATMARQHLTNSPGGETEEAAQDYAGDLLMHLRQNNQRDLRTKTALKRELIRYITQARNPESRELWGVLSAAIRKLAKDGRARRIDGNEGANNSNRVVWTSTPPEEDHAILNIQGFRDRADGIRSYYPQREEGRVMPPSEARELLTALLHAARGPIEFSILFEEAKRHVVLQMQQKKELDAGNPDEEGGDSGTLDLADQHGEQQEWIGEEARHRSERIWTLLVELEVNQQFCLYTIPKDFLEHRITLEQVGETVASTGRRVSEAHQQALGVLRDSLALERLGEDNRLASADPDRVLDPLRDTLRALTGAVVEHLMKKCLEHGLGGNFQ